MDQAEDAVLREPRAVALDLRDEDIIARVRGGDSDAFEVLMRRYNQRLYRTVRSILREPADTEDVLQETYVLAFTHLDQFLGRARFSTWLTRIAVHEALHRRDRQRRVAAIDGASESLPEPTPDPEHGAASAELRRLLEASIDRLPRDFRTVFILRDVEGLSVAETSETLMIPEDTVKTRLHRARRRLQHDLDRAVGQSVREVFPFGSTRCDRLVSAVMHRITPA